MAGATLIDVRLVDNASPTLKKVDDKVRRLKDSVGGTNKKLGGTTRNLRSAAAGFFGMGKAAGGAAVGVKVLDGAIKSAMLPLLAFTAGIASVSAAFNTLKNQDFAEAKVKSLGVNSEELVNRLKLVTHELHGSRDVAELTGAAYDVASAGFTKAADTAAVLKAASMGATGGFSDLNTVGNATTSVLNAYGKSASEANLIVDQFIQTQNDGKIVVAEYAANIGKVASVAAMLKVPLSEVNAIIAQSTAAGVKSEVAFTGLKTALLKLSTSEGQKKLEKLGIDINAASIESEGLAANLKKLEGLGTKELGDIFGAEAIQVMAPVLNNLEKYVELVKKQENAQGAAARAQFLATDTIAGAVKRVQTAFTNLFADGSELGEIVKFTILGIAGTFEVLGAAVKLVFTPIRMIVTAVQNLGVAMGLTGGVVQSVTELWFAAFKNFEISIQKVINIAGILGKMWGQIFAGIGRTVGQVVTNITQNFAQLPTWFASFGNGISEMFATMGENLFQAFKGPLTAIQSLWRETTAFIGRQINAFYDALPDWMKWAIEKVSGVVGGTISEIANVINTPNEQIDIEMKKMEALKLKEIALNNQVAEQIKQQKELWNDVKTTIGQGIHGAIKGIINGTMSLAEGLNSMLNNIANKLLDAGISMALNSMFAGTGMAGFFANGGRPPVGKASIVGERGPEMFVPGVAGTVIPNSKMGGGGTNNIVVNVDASGSSVEGDETQSNELGKMLAVAIQAELVKQQRPGGLLAA